MVSKIVYIHKNFNIYALNMCGRPMAQLCCLVTYNTFGQTPTS